MSIFSNAVLIDEAEADYLLRSGVKSYSPFLKTCPVAVYKLKSAFARPPGKLPVLHGDYIYFLSNSKYRDEFIGNILTYIGQPSPKLVVPPKIVIAGRPKSGKTDLAAKISAEYNLVHLTVPLILESIIAGKENMRLANEVKLENVFIQINNIPFHQISSILIQGQAISDKLVCEAIALVTSRAVCQARGWILDGFLDSYQSIQALEELKVVPNLIIELNEGEEAMLYRARHDAISDAL
jgi:adenylate kinase family enzyme